MRKFSSSAGSRSCATVRDTIEASFTSGVAAVANRPSDDEGMQGYMFEVVTPIATRSVRSSRVCVLGGLAFSGSAEPRPGSNLSAPASSFARVRVSGGRLLDREV